MSTHQRAHARRVDHQRLTSRGASHSTGFTLPSTINHLQRAVGNRAINSLLRSQIIKRKLTVSQPNDNYEREADRVADQVMCMPNPENNAVQRAPMHVQQKCTECEEEEKLQRQPSHLEATIPAVSSNLETYLAASRGGGHPLSPSTRAFFESRFGQTLGHVRVHNDGRAAEASNDIEARAFTAGSDIYFAHGQYRPGSDSGDRLLGHELTHVLQQATGSSSATLQRQASVAKEYSRGNDDQFECCYETGAIKVELKLDARTCDKKKAGKVPASVNYRAVLGGKTREIDKSPSTQPATEGLQHKLVEVGSKNESKLTTSSKKKGAAPGMVLAGSLKVANDTTCDGGTDSGCVEVTGPRGVQQEIKWTTEGKVAKSIEAIQLPQIQEEGTNRLASGLPLLAPGGYPKFANAQPRHKDCWCDPETGYHLNYSDGSRCPGQFFVGENIDPADLPKSLSKTKARPKDLPPICAAQSPNKKICGGEK